VIEIPQHTLKIRRMAAADLDRVLAIAADLATAPHWDRPVYEAAISGEEHVRRIALVAANSTGVVGFALASVIAPEAELESIAVTHEAQRLGVGIALLTGLVQELRGLGVEVLDLEVRESNLAAVAFYRRMGFQEAGRRRGYYRDPTEDALLLRLEFADG
jgi:ribosomal-protein-alanine N-acetyltransferase